MNISSAVESVMEKSRTARIKGIITHVLCQVLCTWCIRVDLWNSRSMWRVKLRIELLAFLHATSFI